MASNAAVNAPAHNAEGLQALPEGHAKLTLQGSPLDSLLTWVCWLQDPVEILEALKSHTEGHAPPQTKLTFRKLPFHAQPYLMPRDTVANRAATKVLPSQPCLYPWLQILSHSD